MSFISDIFGGDTTPPVDPNAPAVDPNAAPVPQVDPTIGLVTSAVLLGLYPSIKNVDVLVPALQKACYQYSINTNLRVAMFLAQVSYESNGFIELVENMNYSASRLTVVFGKYFPDINSTRGYANNPEAIGSKVYANRMGNGDEASHDGWTYRGHGYIQTTGKENIGNFANAVGMALDDAAAYMATPEGAALSAGYFWNTHNLNSFADAGNVLGATHVINGGTNGLADRQALYNHAISLLG